MHAWQEERSAQRAYMACARGTPPPDITKCPLFCLHSIAHLSMRGCVTHRRCPPRRRRVLRTCACPRCSASASAPPAHPKSKYSEDYHLSPRATTTRQYLHIYRSVLCVPPYLDGFWCVLQVEEEHPDERGPLRTRLHRHTRTTHRHHLRHRRRGGPERALTHHPREERQMAESEGRHTWCMWHRGLLLDRH